ELWLALVIENLRNRHHAFGFRPDIDDNVGRGQFYNRAFNDVVVANRFLGFGLKALERGSEVIAASRGILVSGSFRSKLRSVLFRSGRGGSQWFRGRGLCLLGSVYYGRAAGVRVVGRCHGFKTGFKITGGAVVEQVHSLYVDARSCATCGTWRSGLLAWSLGYVEADLADDLGQFQLVRNHVQQGPFDYSNRFGTVSNAKRAVGYHEYPRFVHHRNVPGSRVADNSTPESQERTGIRWVRYDRYQCD